MPRPKKCRRVCGMPKQCRFGPQNHDENFKCESDLTDGKASEISDIIVMTVDEYETIRLIDRLGYNQEECSMQMGIARTTVQAVYNSARSKLAEALVEGRQLIIQGGNYTVCPKGSGCCRKNKKKGGCNHENCSNL